MPDPTDFEFLIRPARRIQAAGPAGRSARRHRGWFADPGTENALSRVGLGPSE
jgi:hypothetical protein